MNDRRGMVQRLRDARRAYRGPFTGEHACKVVEEEGYEPINAGEVGARTIYQKSKCLPVPVDAEAAAIFDDDPTFRCLARDLGMSRTQLRTRLNQVRLSAH